MQTKVTADSEMIKVEYAFEPKEVEKILEENRLEPVIEAGLITGLIQDNEDEWKKLSIKQKLDWIKDEITEWTLLDYLARHYLGGFLSRRGIYLDDCIRSVDYDGAGIVITIGIQVDKLPPKEELEDLARMKNEDKVIYLDDYRRARSGVV